MCGFVRDRISLAVVIYNTLLLNGFRYKEVYIHQRPDLEDEVVIALPALCRR